MRRRISSKSDTCTESVDVYVTDISGKKKLVEAVVAREHMMRAYEMRKTAIFWLDKQKAAARLMR